ARDEEQSCREAYQPRDEPPGMERVDRHGDHQYADLQHVTSDGPWPACPSTRAWFTYAGSVHDGVDAVEDLRVEVLVEVSPHLEPACKGGHPVDPRRPASHHQRLGHHGARQGLHATARGLLFVAIEFAH